MSVPLGDKPDSTTPLAQVINTCLPARELPNQKPIFITSTSDTRTFQAWLRASCPGGPSAHIKGENLIIIPSTANAVGALRSRDGKEG